MVLRLIFQSLDLGLETASLGLGPGLEAPSLGFGLEEASLDNNRGDTEGCDSASHASGSLVTSGLLHSNDVNLHFLLHTRHRKCTCGQLSWTT